jgi:holo-[acyl-carrier protein] synthase
LIVISSATWRLEQTDWCKRHRDVTSVGIELTEISDFRGVLAELEDQYLTRVFTAPERYDCDRFEDPAPYLAERFAAKGATIKALRVTGAQPDWRLMEVRRHPVDGHDEVFLRGDAAQLAKDQGIDRLFLSLSHDAGMAAAIVLAIGESPEYSRFPRYYSAGRSV